MPKELYEEDQTQGEACWHLGLVSISLTEIQCMDCMEIWPKPANFQSDCPECDIG